MKLFDSHAHLTDERFAEDREAVLGRAAAAGVAALTTIASDLEDAEAALSLAMGRTEGPHIWATAGIHPHVADQCTDAALERLAALLGRDRVVAVGETGLDFHYDNAPREAQIEAFRAQLELAERVGLPVVVHTRDAEAETERILTDYSGRVLGVLHCFTGSAELLGAGIAAGWYVSFSGIVTFSSFGDGQRVRAVPDDRLLVETDSPYLAPVPHRGKRNEPAHVVRVVERVAELRGENPERIAETTHENACRFYGVGG